jgi:hypothetical protein
MQKNENGFPLHLLKKNGKEMGTKKKVEMNKNEFLLHFCPPLYLCFDPKKKVAGWGWGAKGEPPPIFFFFF